MKLHMLLAVLIALAPVVWGQASPFSFDRMDFQAAHTEATVANGFQISKMTGGADVTLHSIEPGTPSLRMRANEMEFDWGEGESTMPDAIYMTGNVVIELPEYTVLAGRADIDVARSRAVFTQSPLLKAPQFSEMRAETITYDFASGAISMDKPLGKDILLRQSAPKEAAAPGLLTVDDVDWPALLSSMKEQAAVAGPSPGKRVLALLDANARRFVETSTVDQLAASSDTVLKQLNRVLQRKDFYEADAWAGSTIDADAQALLDRGVDALSAEEVIRLNRGLLEAAYPGAIQPQS